MKIQLDKIMAQKNLSIRQVSNMTGLSKSAIQKIMNPDSNPTIRSLASIAKGLKIEITDLFEL